MEHKTIPTKLTIFDLKAGSSYLQNVKVSLLESEGLVQLDSFNQTASTTITPTSANEIRNPETLALTCRTCGITKFETIEEHHAHYKTEWHKFNMKLKLGGATSIDEKEFTELTAVGELNSSSSDESSEEETPDDHSADEEDSATEVGKLIRKSPKIVFTANDKLPFCIWRALLEETDKLTVPDYITSLNNVHKKTIWTIFMCSGGHFSAAVFDQFKCIKHKTFHRYTTRKKQGGSQSSRDKKSATSRPQSGGASLRRYNETRLREDIVQLVQDWKPEISKSNYIWMFAPGENKKIFLKDTYLDKNDPRIKSIPFTTRRPTLIEINRIHQILTSVELLPAEFVSEVTAAQNTLSKAEETIPIQKDIATRPTPQKADAEPVQRVITPQAAAMIKTLEDGVSDQFKNLYAQIQGTDAEEELAAYLLYVACDKNRKEIVDYLISQGVSPNEKIEEFDFRTVLHKAAFDDNEKLCQLLLERGADPTIAGGIDNRLPIDFAKSKPTRNVFRKFAGKNPNKWDWEKARISLLTEEQEKEKHQKEAERKKKKKKAQQERAKAQKMEEQEKAKKAAELKEAELINKTREDKMKSMTDREMRAEAAERRMGLKKNICDSCSKQFMSIPFQRLTYSYCTVACVLDHKKKLEAV